MISHGPINYEFTRKYRFTLKEDVTFVLDEQFPYVKGELSFSDAAGHVWLTITGYEYRVSAGYSWNGCSPRPLGKFGIWWLGTPDVPATIRASLAHDAGYQMLDAPGFPYSRAQVDNLFLRIMQLNRWPLARVYWAAVRTFGGLDRAITS